MAPRVQPSSLLSLAHVQVAANLSHTCSILQKLAQDTGVAYVLSLTRNYLRPVWQAHVPSKIRAQLLEETAKLLNAQNTDGTGTTIGAAPLYLLALLLGPDIKKLRIELCCYYGCSHQTALLKFLASEGKGLETLELARSTLFRLDRSLLQSVLLSATHLRHLTLKNIANDSILQIIGSHCPNLVSLDVSHSREVTDAGLQQLFLRVEFRDKTMKLPKKFKNQSKTPFDRCKNTVRNLAKTLQKLCQLDKKADAKNFMMILEYCEKRNNLCSELKYLNIANTGVTSAGILLAIRQVPELQSLGEYCHIGRALELLEQTTALTTEINGKNHFKLKCINTSRTTLHRMELISTYFPTLEKLKVSEPMHPPKSLYLIPPSVTSLHLQSIPPTTQWIRGIYDYLNGSQGKVLTELSLRFSPNDTLPIIDLGAFIQNCDNLCTLNIDGASVDWQTNTDIRPLKYLSKIQIGKIVTIGCLCNVIKCAPVLRIAHIYSCYQMKPEDIYNLKIHINNNENRIGNKLRNNNNNDKKLKQLDYPELSCLECFYLYETTCLSQESIKTMISKFPALRRIGNIRNCGLDFSEIPNLKSWASQNNLDVELSAGSHWYSSNCFPLH